MLDDLIFAAVVLVILLLAISGYARAKREGRADECTRAYIAAAARHRLRRT